MIRMCTNTIKLLLNYKVVSISYYPVVIGYEICAIILEIWLGMVNRHYQASLYISTPYPQGTDQTVFAR